MSIQLGFPRFTDEKIVFWRWLEQFYARLKQPRGFRAYMDASQSIPKDADTKILFDTDTYNDNFGWSTTGSKFTAPEDGRHIFAGGVYLESVADTETMITKLFVDGVAVSFGPTSRGNGSHVTGSSVCDILQLEKDQVVDLRVLHTDTVNRNIAAASTHTYFAGSRLV